MDGDYSKRNSIDFTATPTQAKANAPDPRNTLELSFRRKPVLMKATP
jgi:hypothetical protein